MANAAAGFAMGAGVIEGIVAPVSGAVVYVCLVFSKREGREGIKKRK